MEKFIIVFKGKDSLNCDQKYYGTFDSWDEAYDYLCTLPCAADIEHKHIVTLTKP